MTDRRRPAHPIDCDCGSCHILRKRDEWYGCDRCQYVNKCDGHLRVVALTSALAPFYLDANDRCLVYALAKACRQFKAKP